MRPSPDFDKQQSGEAPQLFVGAQNRFDVNQGEIGDCWFLAPLSILAENKHFMERVIPGGQGFEQHYAGIFRFQFYNFGEWKEIVIDDRLPTR